MSAADDFQAGRLREAVAAQTEAVRQHPDDPARRVFLAELLCFAGDLPRRQAARRHRPPEPQTDAGH